MAREKTSVKRTLCLSDAINVVIHHPSLGCRHRVEDLKREVFAPAC